MAKEIQKFYICNECGNIIGLINNSGVPLVCCGQEMTELIPNTEDASTEKHVPEVTIDGNEVTVKVGSTEHPMIKEHYIQWIYIQTKKGGQRKNLKPNEKPEAKFLLTDDDEILIAFEYCNLHGLWMKKI